MHRKEMTRRLLDVTLEIIYLLTGEEYTVVKKTEDGTSIIHLQESGRRGHVHRTEPAPRFLIERILELTNEMTELQTGEVPIRCQDVAVYFSMKEWEYIQGHRDRYKDVMMEDHQPLLSPENRSKNSEENFKLSVNYKLEDENRVLPSSGVKQITLNVQPGLHSTDQSRNTSNDVVKICDWSREGSSCASVNKGKTYECDESGKRLTKSSTPYTHRKRSHTGKKTTYSCSECDKCYTKKSQLEIHERIHTGEKPFTCSECGKHYSSKAYLVVHERSHTGEKPYSCPECDKRYTKKCHLEVHERSHTGEKPFPCSECGKCFSYKSDLVQHQRCHTGGKPYSCSECGKCFKNKAYLAVHERSHTGERPYSCSECIKCFVNKSDLLKHERTHSGEKPFSCPECGKCFRTTSHLVRHERIHVKEKP